MVLFLSIVNFLTLVLLVILFFLFSFIYKCLTCVGILLGPRLKLELLPVVFCGVYDANT